MINMFHDITSLPYVSVWLNKKTHNPWMRIAWSEALGLFSEKTKRYTWHGGTSRQLKAVILSLSWNEHQWMKSNNYKIIDIAVCQHGL